jgi:hypothetical protein
LAADAAAFVKPGRNSSANNSKPLAPPAVVSAAAADPAVSVCATDADPVDTTPDDAAADAGNAPALADASSAQEQEQDWPAEHPLQQQQQQQRASSAAGSDRFSRQDSEQYSDELDEELSNHQCTDERVEEQQQQKKGFSNQQLEAQQQGQEYDVQGSQQEPSQQQWDEGRVQLEEQHSQQYNEQGLYQQQLEQEHSQQCSVDMAQQYSEDAFDTAAAAVAEPDEALQTGLGTDAPAQHIDDQPNSELDSEVDAAVAPGEAEPSCSAEAALHHSYDQLAGTAADNGDAPAVTAASPLAERLAAGIQVKQFSMASHRYTAEDMLAADEADEAADVLPAALQRFGSGAVQSRVC